MADNSNAEDETISKGIAKRKYMLIDDDLEGLQYELKENPLSKSYKPMKIFKLSEVESVAIKKFGSKEKLSSELGKRKQQQLKLENRREEEKRHFWDCEEFYEPLQHFMENMELPAEKTSPYFKDKSAQISTGANDDDVDGFSNCDIILCYCDCLHSVPPDKVARRIFKEYPEARQVDKSTPYNDRRKMGHFSWTLSLSTDQLIMNLYVVHKWKAASRRSDSSVPVLNFEALGVALKRFSTLLSKTLEKERRQPDSLKIGTYCPYRADPETFQKSLQENMEHPVTIDGSVFGRSDSSAKGKE